MTADSNEYTLHVSSGYGARTREPFVTITYDDPERTFDVQMSVPTALEHAQAIIEVAQASVADAFLMEFGMKVVGLDERGAASLMAEFRVWRAEKNI